MLLSIVIPVYNEAETLSALLATLRDALAGLPCEHEILFVNDGSRDQTLPRLQEAAESDPRIKVIGFSRNFGHQAAITAGLDFASGDAVVVMDADLQDPPAILGEMLARYEDGFDVVSAMRVSRQGEPWTKRITASMFYWVMRKMVDDRLLPQVGDFRLFSRRALIAIRQLREQHRFMRGMVAWLGLKETIVPFHRAPRIAGSTKYPMLKMVRFAWTAISSFSALPLRVALGLGIALSAAGFLYFFFALYAAVVLKRVAPGWTSLVFLQCLFSGATLVAIGLAGDYIARIYEEIKGRPLYIVTDCANMQVSAEHRPERSIVLISEPERAAARR